MLEFTDVGKVYKTLLRKTRALGGLSFSIHEGEIVGLVGANGAGKTTLIQLAIGYLYPTEGRVRLWNSPVDTPSLRSRIGWVPDEPIYPRGASAERLLDEWLEGHGWSKDRRLRRLSDLLGQFQMTTAARRPIASYSLGMQQKVSLMLALSHEPDLLIMDEPFSALDRRSMVVIQELLQRFRGSGGSILVSSHHLPELESICDRAVFISNGAVAREKQLRGAGGTVSVHIVLQDGVAAETVLAQKCPPFLSQWLVDGQALTGRLPDRDHVPELVAFLTGEHLGIRSVVEHTGQLEEAFMELEGGA